MPRRTHRSSKRVPLNVQVDWRVEGSLVHFVTQTEDMSRGGMFIRAFTRPELGACLRVRVVPRSGHAGARFPLELEGTVVHRDDRGVGVSLRRVV